MATLTKKDRKDWAALVNGRLVHFQYMLRTEEEGVRPDMRVVNLCNGERALSSRGESHTSSDQRRPIALRSTLTTAVCLSRRSKPWLLCCPSWSA